LRILSIQQLKKGENKMNKKMKWVIAGAVAGLLVAVIAIPVLAAGPNGARGATNPAVSQTGCGNYQGLGLGPDQEVATLLGLTQEQIREQRQAGKSLVQIAAIQNVTEETLLNTIMAENQAAIQNMVAAGTLTQAQADWRLAQMKERVQLAINRTTVGPPEWAGANGQKGTGMMRKSGQGFNQSNCSGSGQMMRAGGNGR
jgi:hypothetical protein